LQFLRRKQAQGNHTFTPEQLALLKRMTGAEGGGGGVVQTNDGERGMKGGREGRTDAREGSAHLRVRVWGGKQTKQEHENEPGKLQCHHNQMATAQSSLLLSLPPSLFL